MIFNSHAHSVNEDRQKNTLLKVFVLDKLLDPSSHAAQRADAAARGASEKSSRPRDLLPLFAVFGPLFATLQLATTGTIIDV